MASEKEKVDRILEKAMVSLVPRQGKWGTAFAASRLPTKSKKGRFIVDKPKKQASTMIQDFFKTKGLLMKPDPKKKWEISGLIGSGFMDMNPSFITVVLRTVAKHKTEICIVASAKEGLINQNTSEKAIEKIKYLLS